METKTIKNMTVTTFKITLRCLWQAQMISAVRRWMFVVAMTCSFMITGQASLAVDIYVDWRATWPEDGTVINPYRTLTSAVTVAVVSRAPLPKRRSAKVREAQRATRLTIIQRYFATW